MRIWKQPKKYNTPRKYKGKCECCGLKKEWNEVYQYYDSSNIAITHNSLYLCKECYIKRYGNV